MPYDAAAGVIVVLGRPRARRARGAGRTVAGRIAAAAAAGGRRRRAGRQRRRTTARATPRSPRSVEPGDWARGAAAHADGCGEPRLDAADIELGLRYVSECRVLVVADPLDGAALGRGRRRRRIPRRARSSSPRPGCERRAQRAARARDGPRRPDEDDGAFAELVGRYAAQLEAGRGAADAWRDALDATGWERRPRQGAGVRA